MDAHAQRLDAHASGPGGVCAPEDRAFSVVRSGYYHPRPLLVFVVFFFPTKAKAAAFRAHSSPPPGEFRSFSPPPQFHQRALKLRTLLIGHFHPFIEKRKKKLMARRSDSNYIDFTQLGGFDMGISFDGFEENMKKLMELPIKYLDSAHDKAVEFIEDVHAILYSPFTDDEVPDKEDESSRHVITKSSPTSVGTELVEPNAEASTPPACLITVEKSCNDSVDIDDRQTESFSNKNTDSSEEVILWNPELTTIPQDDHVPNALETDKVTEQVTLHNSAHSDSNAISQDDYVPHSEQVTEQAGLNCSELSDTLINSVDFFNTLLREDSSDEEQMVSYNANVFVEATTHGGTDESSCAEYPSMLTDKFVDGQMHMANEKIVVSSVPEQRNASFKKMFITNLSRKLWWSKKQANTHQTMLPGSQDADNLGYQLLSSLDELEDDWEVV